MRIQPALRPMLQHPDGGSCRAGRFPTRPVGTRRAHRLPGKAPHVPLCTHLFATGVAIDAFEVRDGNPTGYFFQIIGEPETDLLVLLAQLVGKMRRALSIKHLEDGDYGLQIAEMGSCAAALSRTTTMMATAVVGYRRPRDRLGSVRPHVDEPRRSPVQANHRGQKRRAVIRSHLDDAPYRATENCSHSEPRPRPR